MTIYIDANEHSKHPEFKKSLGKIFDVKVERLPAGDFYLTGITGDVVIERKTVFDFLNSLRKRFWDQLPLLKAYEGSVSCRLLLEGYWGLYRKRK